MLNLALLTIYQLITKSQVMLVILGLVSGKCKYLLEEVWEAVDFAYCKVILGKSPLKQLYAQWEHCIIKIRLGFREKSPSVNYHKNICNFLDSFWFGEALDTSDFTACCFSVSWQF